jgi:glutathione S-transferase
VVPTLVHDGRVLVESSVICEYLDETFAKPALMPQDPYSRAQARVWLKIFDDVAHPAIRQASFELLYRPLLAAMPPAELAARLARHPNPARAQRFREAACGDADATAIKAAMDSFRAILGRMDVALQRNEWLAGADYSLADAAMSSLLDRLDNLGMGELSQAFPHTKDWGAAIMVRPAFAASRAPLEFRLPVPSVRLDERTGR